MGSRNPLSPGVHSPAPHTRHCGIHRQLWRRGRKPQRVRVAGPAELATQHRRYTSSEGGGGGGAELLTGIAVYGRLRTGSLAAMWLALAERAR